MELASQVRAIVQSNAAWRPEHCIAVAIAVVLQSVRKKFTLHE